ncbi:GIY-YIG nuclease family protein [Rhodococcus sp. NPDC056960]|uniref:GIY-YIG nuclease family protein n=1 Tax=Rhodococcus sp. NPDC056960 TaxID=3345982 RepID=UPI00362DBE8B
MEELTDEQLDALVTRREWEPYDSPLEPTFVYRGYDETGRLLYVGVTKQPEQRIKEHSGARWFRESERLDFAEFPTRRAALIAEQFVIDNHAPKYNSHNVRWGIGNKRRG